MRARIAMLRTSPSGLNFATEVTESALLTFAYTVRWDETRCAWRVQDSHGAILGVSPDREDAVQCARRRAMIAAISGNRIIVMLQGEDGGFAHVATAEPPEWDTRPLLSA
jgi:hypothetical protein